MELIEIRDKLLKYLKNSSFCFLEMPDDHWRNILISSSRGVAFSWAAEHTAFTLFGKRSLCLTFGKDNDEVRAYIGIVNSNRTIATTQTRIKVIHNLEIKPSSPESFLEQIEHEKFRQNYRFGKRDWGRAFHVPAGANESLIDLLLREPENIPVLEKLIKKLLHLDVFKNAYSLQVDAIDTALSIFNFDKNNPATSINLSSDVQGDHPLHQYEDNAVNHDQRQFMDYSLTFSDLAGKAVFEKGKSRLEIYLGNKLPLERLFGVDLIFHNVTNNNTVMVQYKMMEKQKKDTIYRPDQQLADEIRRMEQFSSSLLPSTYEYRLNPEHFYLKFVPRDGKMTEKTFLMPLEHYKKWITSPDAKSDRNSVRISFKALNGRYMRPQAFNDLLRSGYIGSYQQTTKHLQTLVNEVLQRGNAFVVALQGYKK